jgi:hypothetical protein
MPPLWHQIVALFVIAIPIACIARTVVFEEIFREPREWCRNKSRRCAKLIQRKFFYLFTCEYCFSHYVTIAFLALTRFKLLYPEWWRGYPIAFFALVFVANAYMNLYARLRVDITSEKKAIELTERQSKVKDQEIEARARDLGQPANSEGSEGHTSDGHDDDV